MERLTKRTADGKVAYALLQSGECVDPIDLLRVWGDRLAAYEDIMTIERAKELYQAEKDGRLAVLPCSLHQSLYILKNGEIHRNYGFQWHFTDKESQNFGTLSLYGEFVSLDDFGKTIFLTREDAEAELKKREEVDNEAD